MTDKLLPCPFCGWHGIHMRNCMQYERECDGCSMNGADGTITAPVGCDGLRDRMRELGVSGHEGVPSLS